MATDPDLLPPNSTELERALSLAMGRLGDVPVPLRDMWDPLTCPIELLPWLAWGLSIDRWRADWTEFEKRRETARAIELQRLKGTPAAVEEVLASYDRLLQLVEWFEMEPRGTPHTFQILIPLDGTPTARSTAAFALEVIRDIDRTKPARSHYEVLLQLSADAALDLQAGAHSTLFRRLTFSAATGMEDALLTETGSALLSEDGQLLEVN